jgi:hypothetical protein
MRISIGADPEFFVWRRHYPGNGGFVSAHDLVNGTKDEPYIMRYDPIAGAQFLQADGTACEINVGAVTCGSDDYQDIEIAADSFAYAVRAAMSTASAHLPVGHQLKLQQVVEYDLDYFRSLPSHATELGCDPDYNAYTGQANVIKIPEDKPTMRTAAGHIHIGWLHGNDMVDDPFEANHFNDCRLVVLNLDKMWRKMQPLAEANSIRRLMYGDFGAFRPKPYGVEWRTPSNLWCRDHHTRVDMAEACLETVYETFKKGYHIHAPGMYSLECLEDASFPEL